MADVEHDDLTREIKQVVKGGWWERADQRDREAEMVAREVVALLRKRGILT